MLDATIGPEFGFMYTNWSVPSTFSAPCGTSIVPGASNAEGSWTQIASAANIAAQIFGFELYPNLGSLAGQQKSHLLDIGIDPAGGSSYTAIISNLVCGQSASIGNPCAFYFPLHIPAGASVAARIQGNNATAGTMGLAARFFGRPKRPELARAGSFSETIGAITNSSGVTFTPGVSTAEGSWTTLGTTSRELWWWQLGVQVDDATITTTQTLFIDLAYGDVTNKVMIIESAAVIVTSSEQVIHGQFLNAYKRVPAGSSIFIRGSIDLAVADSGYNAVAVGVGG